MTLATLYAYSFVGLTVAGSQLWYGMGGEWLRGKTRLEYLSMAHQANFWGVMSADLG